MKIISGGQTGVDRAALDVAIERGMDWGGWCPQGRLGRGSSRAARPSAKYPQLKETPHSNPLQRTEWNVRDSDATSSSPTAQGCRCPSARGAPINGRASTASPSSSSTQAMRKRRARRGVARCAAQALRAGHDARHRRSARERGAGHLQERSAVHRRAARACEATPLSRSGVTARRLATPIIGEPGAGPGPCHFADEAQTGQEPKSSQ